MKLPKSILDIIKDIISSRRHSKKLVTIAELSSDVERGLRRRDINTVLLNKSLISRIKPSNINVPVKMPGASYYDDYIYKPRFWMYLSPSYGLKKAEPLVVSWMNVNHITLYPDQGFLGTFGLSPRLAQDRIYWDDLASPQQAVIENKPLSFYDFPNYPMIYVRMNKKYLQDYLSLRKKIAVLVYEELRDITRSPELDAMLNSEGYFQDEYENYKVVLKSTCKDKNMLRLEICGYHILLEPEGHKPKKHYWKGLTEPIDGSTARQKKAFDYVYVTDDVLAKYEEDEHYEVCPETGGVRYENHWSVSYCKRVGRSAIRLEVKKLYEGTPGSVIDYWNKFTIDPVDINFDEHSIVDRAVRLVDKYLLFGDLLAQLLNRLGRFNYSASELIGLDRAALHRTGITSNTYIKSITHHVSETSFSKDQFLARCKKLNVFLNEGLSEKRLRKVVDHLGFVNEETKDLRSLRLLSLIFDYLNVAYQTGLNPKHDSPAILDRINESKLPSQLLYLITLNRIRQLDAHRGGDSNKKFSQALKDLNIDKGTIFNNYAEPCHQVYERLNDMFIEVNEFLVLAFDFED